MTLLSTVLTVLGVLVVTLTRLRLAPAIAAGTGGVKPGVLNAHTGAGIAAILLWLLFLALNGEKTWVAVIGVLGLGCWWVTAVTGLMLASRWIGYRQGPRSADETSPVDDWSHGPGLSILAHGTLFIGVAILTQAYLVASV